METQAVERQKPVENATEAARLWSLPAFNIIDLFSIILGIPASTAEQIITECPPPAFQIGRRRLITREAALEYIGQLEERYPYTKRINNPRKTSP